MLRGVEASVTIRRAFLSFDRHSEKDGYPGAKQTGSTVFPSEYQAVIQERVFAVDKRYKAVAFDMDGTLIRGTDSVQYLCSLNGRKDELRQIEKRENSGELSWIEADHLKARLLRGLPRSRISESFDREVPLISGTAECLARIRALGLKTVLLTAGPLDVARALAERLTFDAVCGSEYEVVNGVYMGRISKHLDALGKLAGLADFCRKQRIGLHECIAVGDSASDDEVFRHCGKSIAINYSQALVNRADEYLMTEDLRSILDFIV